MKGFLIILILLIVLGILGYFAFTKFVQPSLSAGSDNTTFKTEPVTKVGVLQPSIGDDYKYAILSEGKLIGVASYTLKLEDYIGKTVSVTGQYSGTTLYADSVTPQ